MLMNIAHDVNKKGAKVFNSNLKIDEAENLILDSTNNHFYEDIQTTNRKIYIDIDYGARGGVSKYKYMTVSEFDSFQCELINVICNKLEIENKGVIVQVVNTKIKGIVYITSCHIIFSNHSMHYKEQQQLIKDLNDNHKYKLDPVIYKKRQLFRFVNHTKHSKNNKLVFYTGSYTFAQCVIANTEQTKLIKYTQQEKEEEKQEEEQENPQEQEQEQEQEQIKKVRNCSNILEILDHIIKHEIELHNMKTDDWLLITKIFLKIPHLFDINDWCKLSSVNSDYTTDDNLKFCNDWINGGSVKLTQSGIPKLIEVLNKYLPYNIKQISKLNINELVKHIKTITNGDNINYNLLYEVFNKQYGAILKLEPNQQKNKKLKYEAVTFYISSGFLSIKGHKDTYNFYYNHLIYDGSYIQEPIIYNQTFTSIADPAILQTITQNLELTTTTPQPKVTVINASYGIGKTWYILNHILKQIGTSQVLAMVTPNNTFNVEVCEKLNKNGYQKWVSHTEKVLTNRLRNYEDELTNLICSLESIYKIQQMGDLDLLILDEFTSIFAHFESDTVKEYNKFKTYQIFKEILQNAKKIIIMDASISTDQINFLQTMIDEPIYKINITDSKFNEYNHIIYQKEKLFNNALTIDLQNNKNVSICSNSKKQTEIYRNILIGHIGSNGKNILIVNSDKIEIVRVIESTTRTTREILKIESKGKERHSLLSKIEPLLIEHNINHFIYSPTINMGVSIGSSIFNAMYCHFCKNSVQARGCMQMIYRNRQLIDQTINIYCSSGFTKPTPERDYKIYKQNRLRATQMTKQDLNIDDVFNDDDDYNKLRSINYKEIYESDQNFTQQMHILLNAYKCKVSYIIEDEQATIKTIEEKDRLLNEQYEAYKNIKILSGEEYVRLSKKPNTDLTGEEINQKQKYNQLYNMIGYTEIIDEGGYSVYTYKKRLSFGLYSEHHTFFNSKEFFVQIINKSDKISTHKNVINYLKYSVEKDKIDKETSEYKTDEMTKHLIKNIQYRILNKLVDMFDIDLNGIRTITNSGFAKIIFDNIDYFKDTFYEHIKIANMETCSPPAITNQKKYIKWIYEYIKCLLKTINIEMKYNDKTHTTSGKDKMTFQQGEGLKFDMNNKRFDKPYHKFEVGNNGISFEQKFCDRYKTITNKKMSYKTYSKGDIICNKRLKTANDTGNKLYIQSNGLYKEYTPNLTKKIIELSERIETVETKPIIDVNEIQIYIFNNQKVKCIFDSNDDVINEYQICS